MPTGRCNYPHHHTGGPSAGPPAGLIVAILLGALVVIEWRTVLVALAVVVALAVAAGAMVLLWHSHHAEPYDAAWSVEDRAELPAGQYTADVQLRARVGQLERQLAERDRPGITTGPRVVHQHVHLHGVAHDQLAEIGIAPDGRHTLARRALSAPNSAVTAEPIEED